MLPARLSALLLLTFSSLAFAGSPPPNDVEGRLRELISAQADAWNRGDAAAWSKDFAPDADFINIVGTALTGKGEIEKRHAAIFAGIFKGSRTQVTVDKVRLFAPHLAAVDMQHLVTGYAGLPPGVQATEPGKLRTRMRYLFTLKDGRWWIALAQNTEVKPPPPVKPG
jgi:uncharacterized protein (TIGR02246 family)